MELRSIDRELIPHMLIEARKNPQGVVSSSGLFDDVYVIVTHVRGDGPRVFITPQINAVTKSKYKTTKLDETTLMVLYEGIEIRAYNLKGEQFILDTTKYFERRVGRRLAEAFQREYYKEQFKPISNLQ